MVSDTLTLQCIGVILQFVFFSYFGYTAERATGPNGNGSKNKYRKKVEGISKDFVVKIQAIKKNLKLTIYIAWRGPPVIMSVVKDVNFSRKKFLLIFTQALRMDQMEEIGKEKM